MSRVLSETIVPVEDVGKFMPGGTPIGRVTFWRWHAKGILNSEGERVRLETAKFGRRRVTSVEAIRRFSEALTGQTAADGARDAG